MNIREPKTILLAAAAVLGAASTVLAAGPSVWKQVGWTTPAQVQQLAAKHAADVDALESMADDIQTALGGELASFRDELRCGDLDRELRELLRAQRNGDDSIETEQRIERIRELRSPQRYNCVRFEE